MVPDVVEFCEALPRNSNGKVDRARLAQHGR
jgi:acyl-coenzyme A synthetase/AMP-(fatty) acid ligase